MSEVLVVKLGGTTISEQAQVLDEVATVARRRPVVLVHGLWGNSRLWDPMVEDLEADPAIRSRYQFWTFRYSSGDSIPYSAHLLRQSLRRARQAFDPNGTDATFDQMVIVGHRKRAEPPLPQMTR